MAAKDPIDVTRSLEPNELSVGIGVLADEWTLWLLGTAIAQGTMQFSDWTRQGPISSSVLSERLRRLIAAGLLERISDPAPARSTQYRLTSRGAEVWPVFVALWDWERRWADNPHPDLPDMRHRACGNVLSVRFVCRACRSRAQPKTIRIEFGPSWSWSRTLPVVATRRKAVPPWRERGWTVLSVIGNRWSAVTLGAAFLGASRFADFTEPMDASPAVITDRLQALVGQGILTTSASPDRADRRRYALDAKGLALYPVLSFVVDWAQRWFPSPDGPALVLTHESCGERFVPGYVCRGCGQDVDETTLQVLSRP